MDYNVQAKNLEIVAQYFDGIGIPDDYVQKIYRAAESITDLLTRAEAAEARCEMLESANRVLSTRITTAEKMVKEYQDELIPGYRERAEKAERCINAIEDDLDRGSDNDWARGHIAEYRGTKEE